MAARYQIWNGTDDIYTPSGAKFTAEEWREKFLYMKIPGAKMIISSGIINGGYAMEFTSTVAEYKRRGAEITDGMTDEEILAAIEAYEDNPPGADEPTVEERTAAALEFLALNSLPDDDSTTA